MKAGTHQDRMAALGSSAGFTHPSGNGVGRSGNRSQMPDYPSSSDEYAANGTHVEHPEGMEGEEGEEGVASFFVRALYDFTSDDSSSLSFKKGALIEVLTQLESGWWDGLLGNDVRGWFPSNYVEIISDEDAERELRDRAQQLMQRNALAQSAAADALNGRNTDGNSRQVGPMMSPTEASFWLTGAQGNASAVASLDAALRNSFDGLGLGKEFDPLRALMSGEGLNTNDAFEELAEAAMQRQDPDGTSTESDQMDSSSEVGEDVDTASNGTIEGRPLKHKNRIVANIGKSGSVGQADRPRGNSLPHEPAGAALLPNRRRAETAAAVSRRPGVSECAALFQ